MIMFPKRNNLTPPIGSLWRCVAHVPFLMPSRDPGHQLSMLRTGAVVLVTGSASPVDGNGREYISFVSGAEQVGRIRVEWWQKWSDGFLERLD